MHSSSRRKSYGVEEEIHGASTRCQQCKAMPWTLSSEIKLNKEYSFIFFHHQKLDTKKKKKIQNEKKKGKEPKKRKRN